MNKKKILIIGTVLFVLAIGITLVLKSSGKSQEQQVQTEFAVVNKGDINTLVTATGTIEPLKVVEVGTQVSGVVEKIYVDYNSHVTAGQLIAELDKTNLLASLTDARASLKNALNEQEYLKKIFERQKTLFDSKLISEADFDEAQYRLNNAISTVEQRQSAVKRAETNLAYASVYSPISGVVLSRAVELGQTVAASFNTPTLFTIAQDLTSMQVEADVDEADIGQVREGQRVTFTVDAFLGETFEGKVTQVRLNAMVTSNVVTYTVVIDAPNPEQKLMPGMTATISIYTIELKNVLTLPLSVANYQPDMSLVMQYMTQSGIQPGPPPESMHLTNDTTTMPVSSDGEQPLPPTFELDKETKMIWVKDGKAIKPQPVKLGQSNEFLIEVKEGLLAGDSVLTAIKAESQALPQASAASGSPFMPKPPGRRK